LLALDFSKLGCPEMTKILLSDEKILSVVLGCEDK